MRISLHPGAEHDVAKAEKLIQEAIAFHVAAQLRTPEESAL